MAVPQSPHRIYFNYWKMIIIFHGFERNSLKVTGVGHQEQQRGVFWDIQFQKATKNFDSKQKSFPSLYRRHIL